MNGSSQQGGPGDRSPELSEADLSARRDRLNRELDERRRSELLAEAKRSARPASGYGQAMKLSSEFIAGILVGGGIGWVLDEWLGTSPFGLIVFLLLGFAAGVLNVLRAAGKVAEQGSETRAQMDRDDAR